MFIIFSCGNLFSERKAPSKNNNIEKLSKPDTISVIGVGDMMLGSNYPTDDFLPPDDGKNAFASFKELLQSANITFGNLEGVLLTGSGIIKNMDDTLNSYAFKSPDYYIKYFKDAGFDILNIANNHINDFGYIGRKNTQKLLEENGIYFAGVDKYPCAIFSRDNIRYGFCAFAVNGWTLKIYDYEKVIEIVKHLDTLCDVVIVSFHGGTEGNGNDRVSRTTEYYIGENRGNVYEFSRKVIDAGADIVFGHGPHTVRAVDVYKDRFIAYSLGNFATYRGFNLTGKNKLAPLIKIKVNNSGEFLSGFIHSGIQLWGKGLMPDTLNRAAKEIKKLTELDFPESQLIINQNGEIIKRKL